MRHWAAAILIGFCLVASVTSIGAQGTKPIPSSHPVINGGLPIVSPDGSRIAFVSDRSGVTDLFVISADGTGEVQLTHTPEQENPAGWTKDGKQVLFSVFANDLSTLYAISVNGKGRREIGKFSGRSPVPSPDGKRVIYMAGTWTATKLMVSTVDGSRSQQITDGSSIAWNSDWSPNGKRLAFTGRNGPKSELAIFVMNTNGAGLRQVTHIAPEEGGAQSPAWSPDGKKFALQVNNRASRNSAYIWIADVATGEARKLGLHDKSYLDETPSWFPDGKRIAFQSNRTGRMEIWVMNADGSRQLQVTR
jgi:TolB protein